MSQLSPFDHATWQHPRESPRHVRGSAGIYDVRMAQFVLKIEKLSHIMGPRASHDLRSPSLIMAPGVVRWRHELDYICPLWVLSKFGPIEAYMCRVIANWFFPSNGIKRYFNGPLSGDMEPVFGSWFWFIIVPITKFSIVIGSPCAYMSRNRHAITWVSNYSCPIWTFCNWTPVIGYPRDFRSITRALMASLAMFPTVFKT